MPTTLGGEDDAVLQGVAVDQRIAVAPAPAAQRLNAEIDEIGAAHQTQDLEHSLPD
jgi:hypothetical protein